ncbi:MAG: biotin/lipoyl-binding protein [Vampirovibrionales bacterium]|nr:biotin/lipoyl-binding protein [Vampirovibrionales bacterium]
MTTSSITIGSDTAQWATTPSGWELTLPNGTIALIGKDSIAPLTTEGPTQKGLITLQGKQWPYAVAYSTTHIFLWVAGQTITLPKPQNTKGRRGSNNTGDNSQSSGLVSATMPGNIVSVAVAVGQPVTSGDVLVVMESMKMELSLTSAIAGTITTVNVAEGDKVSIGQVLVEVTPAVLEEVAS